MLARAPFNATYAIWGLNFKYSRAFPSYLPWISLIYSHSSLDDERMMGSLGWKAISLMEAVCPGSFYKIFLLVVSHTYTNLLADPTAVFFHQIAKTISEDSFQSWAHFLEIFYHLHYHPQDEILINLLNMYKICKRKTKNFDEWKKKKTQ